MQTEPLITLSHLNHYFGAGALRKQILFDICAECMEGEIVILTGPSGSGKTTVLTLIGSLRTVQEGSARVLGFELGKLSPADLVKLRKKIGFIFQAHNLLDALTARQNVLLALHSHGPISKKEADARACELLTAVGLGQRIEHYPSQLSGGQRQRVAIARALVGRPRIVLADEPTAALDKHSGREVVQILHDLAKKQGTAILLVTHDNRILDVADRILTLEDGRIASFAKGVSDNAGQMLTSLADLNQRGTLARHVKDLSPKLFTEFIENSTREMEEMLNTIDAARQKVTTTMLDRVLETATVKIAELLDADRATLFLVDEEKRVLQSKVALHEGAQPLEITVSMDAGVAGSVARTGQALNIPDAQQSPLFNTAVDKATGYHTHNILCLPIYDRGGKVFAVAQLLNKRGGEAFSEADEKTFREFAHPLGVILETCCQLNTAKPGADRPASSG